MTLHSWSGCKLAAGPWEALRDGLTPASEQRWRDTDCLIIDESSMLDPRLFTEFEALARAVRGSTEPFGGIQVIACGDFLQLPPVRPGKTADAPGSFAFDTAAWKKTFRANVLLTEGHRQHEPELLELLRSVRRGELTPQALDTISDCATHALDFAPGIEPTVLYATLLLLRRLLLLLLLRRLLLLLRRLRRLLLLLLLLQRVVNSLQIGAVEDVVDVARETCFVRREVGA
jgi:ATP-dependent DNA helicase PIF1